jgi:hypothetical protein
MILRRMLLQHYYVEEENPMGTSRVAERAEIYPNQPMPSRTHSQIRYTVCFPRW